MYYLGDSMLSIADMYNNYKPKVVTVAYLSQFVDAVVSNYAPET